MTTIPPGDPVPSPCTSVCTIEPRTGLCVGCFRSLDEIAAWSALDDDAKRAVWSALPGRRAELARAAEANDPARTGADAQR